MTAKSAPYPPCTVTALWLKKTGRGRCLRRVTQPPHIAGPLVAMRACHKAHSQQFTVVKCVGINYIAGLITYPKINVLFNISVT
jgi:hypothetical protein